MQEILKSKIAIIQKLSGFKYKGYCTDWIEGRLKLSHQTCALLSAPKLKPSDKDRLLALLPKLDKLIQEFHESRT
jgi:hypothetical protein